MALPKDLFSGSKKRLERKAAPSLQDLIDDGRVPELSAESRAGINAQAALVSDDFERYETILAARARAAIEQRNRDNARWDEIQSRRARHGRFS